MFPPLLDSVESKRRKSKNQARIWNVGDANDKDTNSKGTTLMIQVAWEGVWLHCSNIYQMKTWWRWDSLPYSGPSASQQGHRLRLEGSHGLEAPTELANSELSAEMSRSNNGLANTVLLCIGILGRWGHFKMFWIPVYSPCVKALKIDSPLEGALMETRKAWGWYILRPYFYFFITAKASFL